MLDIVEICRNVLSWLYLMDFEQNGRISTEQLFFPKKQSNGTKEKELRLLFI